MTLILLDLGECCFTGTVLILGGSEGSGPSAPKVKVGRETPCVGCSLAKRRRRITRGASEAQSCRGGGVVRFLRRRCRVGDSVARSEGAPEHVSVLDV
jgi:hypothetical protein